MAFSSTLKLILANIILQVSYQKFMNAFYKHLKNAIIFIIHHHISTKTGLFIKKISNYIFIKKLIKKEIKNKKLTFL